MAKPNLSESLSLGFLIGLVTFVLFLAESDLFLFTESPSFAVTTHSLALPASSRPIKVALVRCRDMTFSKRIQ